MKRCGYCGRESEDTATICSGCGLELSEAEEAAQLHKKFFQLKPIGELLGYVAAIPVAFVVSIATFFLAAFLLASLQINIFNLSALDGMVGFNGVFFGALCFPRSDRIFRNRVFGSALLLVLGLGFEVSLSTPTTHGKILSPADIIATAIGGLIALALHYWRKPAKPNS